jgi:hypothetical protein
MQKTLSQREAELNAQRAAKLGADVESYVADAQDYGIDVEVTADTVEITNGERRAKVVARYGGWLILDSNDECVHGAVTHDEMLDYLLRWPFGRPLDEKLP